MIDGEINELQQAFDFDTSYEYDLEIKTPETLINGTNETGDTETRADTLVPLLNDYTTAEDEINELVETLSSLREQQQATLQMLIKETKGKRFILTTPSGSWVCRATMRGLVRSVAPVTSMQINLRW
jgi:hypothetical protein